MKKFTGLENVFIILNINKLSQFVKSNDLFRTLDLMNEAAVQNKR